MGAKFEVTCDDGAKHNSCNQRRPRRASGNEPKRSQCKTALAAQERGKMALLHMRR
jgi:hypothetical protein